MADRKVFHDSVVPLPETAGLTAHGLMVAEAEPEIAEAPLDLVFALDMPEASRAELEEKVARGEVVSAADQQKNYGAKKEDIAKLVAWLKGEGFEVTKVSPNGTGVYARANAHQIEKSLQVHMVNVTNRGVTQAAASNAPSMPADVGAGVRAIIGLQPYRRANKHLRTSANLGPVSGRAMNLHAGALAAAAPAAAVAPNPPYMVQTILKAYNANGLGLTGAGQTIAILIDTLPEDADLEAFWNANQLPVTMAQIEKINVPGGPLPPIEGEETLDASWASGIAPGAQVRVYASGSLEFVALDLALDQILSDLVARPEMRQLSISLGLGELFMGAPGGEVAIQHQKYLQLAAAGVNIFVSSGDAGSNPDQTGQSPTGPLQAEYGSSDSACIGVGGTSLRLKPDGTVKRERGWVAGGGGKSVFFRRPTWQKGAGVPNGTERLVPDVSLVADPDTGAFLVVNGQVKQIGGTSWSAPVWAGFCALMNEARGKVGKPRLGFLNPLIYPLLGTNAFRDVTAGSNGAFSAHAGYDLVTGLGVPDVAALIAKLTM